MNAQFPSDNSSLTPVQATQQNGTQEWLEGHSAQKNVGFFFLAHSQPAHSSYTEDCINIQKKLLHTDPPSEVTRKSQHNHNGLETLLLVDAVSTFKGSVLIAA